MTDNFELIKPLFYFNEANDMFFHCQIVQRAKDHKPNKVKEGAINTYLIRELPKYCCSVCGGTNIQLQAWIDPNSNNKYIEDTEDDECWCEDCQEHTKIKKIN